MGEKIAAVIMAMLVVIAGYNILTHPAADQAILNGGSTGSVGIIKALEGR